MPDISEVEEALYRSESWRNKFLGLAEYVSKWSKDPSTKVGAVITTHDHEIVSIGYNGLPRKVQDTAERLNNRDLKYKMICHAERNALTFAKRDLTGCTLYTFPFGPCPVCAGMFIQANIGLVVFPGTTNPRWFEDIELSKKMFTEAGIQFEQV
jgi:dCMP deaminase